MCYVQSLDNLMGIALFFFSFVHCLFDFECLQNVLNKNRLFTTRLFAIFLCIAFMYRFAIAFFNSFQFVYTQFCLLFSCIQRISKELRALEIDFFRVFFSLHQFSNLFNDWNRILFLKIESFGAAEYKLMEFVF